MGLVRRIDLDLGPGGELSVAKVHVAATHRYSWEKYPPIPVHPSIVIEPYPRFFDDD